MICYQYCLNILIGLLLYTRRIYGQVTINVPAVGNYGEETHMNCQETNFNIVNGYTWYKDNVKIYDNLNGEAASTGKYTSTYGTGIFTLNITNTEVDDAGVYACDYNFDPKSSRLDIEAKGTVTAELSSSSSGKLEVTFHKIYPSEILVVITCDSSQVTGAFVTNVTEGTLFTRKWESSTVFSSKPSACSVAVTLRTIFTIAFDVISASTPKPDCRICWTGCKDWGKVLCILVCIIIILLALLVVGIIAGMVVEAICHIWERMSKKKRIASICALLFGLGLFLLYKLIRRIAAANKPGGNDSTNNSSDDIPLNKNQSHVMNTKYGRTRPLSTVEGGKVTLSCPFPESVTYPEWRGPTKLMLYTKMNDQSGEINSNAPAFERLQYASNKRDLILSNAVTSDSGDYTCSYTGQGNHTIVLKVNPGKGDKASNVVKTGSHPDEKKKQGRPQPPPPGANHRQLPDIHDRKGRGLSANYTDDDHPLVSINIPTKKPGALESIPDSAREEVTKKKKKKKKKRVETEDDQSD